MSARISPLRGGPVTQPQRVYAYLLAHPTASSWEINTALHITNATARLSEIRDELEGTDQVLVKAKRPDGRWGYSVAKRPPLDLGLAS